MHVFRCYKQLDIISASMFLTPAIGPSLDFIRSPICVYELRLVVPYPKEQSRILALIKPFQLQVSIMVIFRTICHFNNDLLNRFGFGCWWLWSQFLLYCAIWQSATTSLLMMRNPQRNIMIKQSLTMLSTLQPCFSTKVNWAISIHILTEQLIKQTVFPNRQLDSFEATFIPISGGNFVPGRNSSGQCLCVSYDRLSDSSKIAAHHQLFWRNGRKSQS